MTAEMVKILLLEDEHYTRRFLVKLVSENPLVEKVIDTSNGTEAISLAREHSPNIILLDIELAPEEGLNGIQVAKKIYNFNPETYFVFITGYSQYAVESFSVHPYDYILKPVKKDKVNELINSLADKVNRNGARNGSKKIMIKVNNENLMIVPGDILFVEKHNKISFINTGYSVYQTYHTLSELENKLGDNFLRVHKSYLANMNKISKIREVSNRSYEISFLGYDKIALMSRHKFQEYKQKVTLCSGRSLKNT